MRTDIASSLPSLVRALTEQAADLLVAVVPNVVEGHKPVRPGTEYWVIQTQSTYDRIDVVGPKSRIAVSVTRLVGEAVAAQVDGHKSKVA